VSGSIWCVRPARSLPGMMLYNFLRGAKVMARDSMGSVMGSAIADSR